MQIEKMVSLDLRLQHAAAASNTPVTSRRCLCNPPRLKGRPRVRPSLPPVKRDPNISLQVLAN